MTRLFEERKFNIPVLKGISTKTIEEHLKLYSGYVKNTNMILTKIDEYVVDSENNAYALGELQRRFSFEFDGMRNHEYYFTHLDDSSTPFPKDGLLGKMIEEEWKDFDKWLNRFRSIALTRGVGWTILYYDSRTKRLLNAWIDEHHLGHLIGLSPILVLDMWEHAYFIDYTPGEKKKYIEAFFENLNWNNVEQNFVKARQ
ncbi:MAG: Fe-Mn family superoxide dismutase [bacterium]|nr:Fe-Mn family superoxide dismutase [bacterium]